MEFQEDDGYDGWLYNPENGRTFKANRHLNKIKEYERVDGPDDKGAKVTVSKKPDHEEVAAVVEEAPADDASEAQSALDDIMVEASATEDKTELKVLGAQIGLKLAATMNVSTMRERIKAQVDAIASAS